MPLQISRNDLRKIKADAIVDPTDVFLSGSGSIDRRIHELAGEGLKKELEAIASIEPGQAVITGSHDLKNCRYIIHTCGPQYVDGKHEEKEILASCYKECLKIAAEKELSSIAFPLIASGTFGFPKGQALKTANDTICDFLLDNEMDVFLLVYDKESFDTAGRLYSDIKDYLDRNLPQAPLQVSSSYHKEKPKKRKASSYIKPSAKKMEKMEEEMEYSFNAASFSDASLPDQVFEPDESFSQCLIRMIDEKQMLDPEVYKRANIDRKHFNHIKNEIHYRPKKETAVALAIGMRLNMEETAALLERAGFVLSRSSKFDLIIRYCIEHKIYNIFQINEILFSHDQRTLGC
ncbi:MAG: macro domain-containing protein [Erysipelotrichaceae bacterium]|nr:macro domain-containing protein [Erysipelotrichaceae bacterium]